MGFSNQCPKCKQVKWWYEFYKDKDLHKKFGIKSICKACTAEQIFKYQQENKVEYELYREFKVPITQARQMLNTNCIGNLKSPSHRQDKC
jgi:hypothetical protein